MLKDTIYYNIGFGGYSDESIQNVIDNGVIIKRSNGGNWDYFYYDNGYFDGVKNTNEMNYKKRLIGIEKRTVSRLRSSGPLAGRGS